MNRVEFHEKDYDKMMSVISKEGETIMVSHHVSHIIASMLMTSCVFS